MENPNQKQEKRNKRIYELHKRGAYTMRGLANMFRLSAPRVCEIIKKERSMEQRQFLFLFYKFYFQLKNKDYKIVKQEILANGKRVSTIWLGLDHQFGKGKPLIFETMVFSQKRGYEELDCCRYSTLETTKKGHKEMVKKWK